MWQTGSTTRPTSGDPWVHIQVLALFEILTPYPFLCDRAMLSCSRIVTKNGEVQSLTMKLYCASQFRLNKETHLSRNVSALVCGHILRYLPCKILESKRIKLIQLHSCRGRAVPIQRHMAYRKPEIYQRSCLYFAY